MQTSHHAQKVQTYERTTLLRDGSEVVEVLPFTDAQVHAITRACVVRENGIPIEVALCLLEHWNRQAGDRIRYRLEASAAPAEAPVPPDLSLQAAQGQPKRVVAVITFEDPENDISDLSDVATWLEAALSAGGRGIDVTVYRNAEDALLDTAGENPTPQL